MRDTGHLRHLREETKTIEAIGRRHLRPNPTRDKEKSHPLPVHRTPATAICLQYLARTGSRGSLRKSSFYRGDPEKGSAVILLPPKERRLYNVAN
jgi:hypothetical protein